MLAGAVFLSMQARSAAEDTNPLGLAMVRQHAETFEPGKPFEISVTISAAVAGQITAMGLRETLPPEWKLEAVAGAGGAPPDLSPKPGATDLLEFAWITMPQLPYTFTYVVTPPEGDGGNKVIHGALEYRQMGGAHYAPPVITEVRGPDPKPPTITLKGANPVTLSVGDAWQEPGYTALDGKNQDITGKVVVSGSVDTGSAGEYALEYTVSTDNGLRATATRRVVVKENAGKQTTASAGKGTVSAGTSGPSGRELSNPIAASAGKNDANKTAGTVEKAATANEGEAAASIKRPDLPDLSAFRPPATPQPGDKPDSPSGNNSSASASALGATGSNTPATSVPPIQHRAPIPAEMLKAAAKKKAADKGAEGASFTTPTASPKTRPPASAVPGASAEVIACVVAAFVLLGGLGLLGWRLVYNRPIRRKRPPAPPAR